MLRRDLSPSIADLAVYAPRFAYAKVIDVPFVPFVGDIDVTFTSSAVGAPMAVAALDNNLTQNTIIERISYTLYQQNSFPGSPLQPWFNAQLKQASGIAVMAAVYGGPKYTLNDVPTPLENLADILAVNWPAGWPLDKQSNVKLSFVLTQTPQSVPYDVSVTLLGTQCLDKCIDDLSDEEARCRLRKLGIWTPDLSLLATEMPGSSG